MKTELSLELRNKIRKDMLIVKHEYVTHKFHDNTMPLDHSAIVSFNENEKHLKKECVEWLNMINTYFKSAYHGGAARRIGRFTNVKPIKIHINSVEFSVENYEKVSWKDWFIEGDGDAPKLVAKLLPNICNT